MSDLGFSRFLGLVGAIFLLELGSRSSDSDSDIYNVSARGRYSFAWDIRHQRFT